MNRSLQYEVDLTSVAELRLTRQREYTTLYFRDIRRSKNVTMLKKVAFKKKFTSQRRTFSPGRVRRPCSRHRPRVRTAPSSKTWPPPWSASHRGWSADVTLQKSPTESRLENARASLSVPSN